jgi:hypothetical protein
VLVRHDVDLSLDAALEMAALEADAGARATYLLMTRSVFYNLASNEGTRAIARLRELGHGVGLHAVHPHVDLDSRFDPVVAWHNPEPTFMYEAIDGAANPMAAPWFSRDHYRSDSNQHWRSGCPHDELARRELEWLQLLIHPEIWVFPGATMRETMLAFVAAERERRLEQLADDKIDLS